jgi:hypothetical protein
VQRGEPIESLGAWVRVVALNLARGRLRKRAVEARARARVAQAAETRPDRTRTFWRQQVTDRLTC